MAEEKVIYNEDSVTYDSFSGTEQTLYINLKTKQSDGTYKIEEYRLGKVANITVNTQTSGKPIHVLGKKKAIAYAQGMTVTGGAISFEVLDESVINQISETAGSLKNLPPFDVKIVAVKENNSKINSIRVIKNIIIQRGSSAIGLDALTVGESYNFTAQYMTPFITDDSKLTTKQAFSFQVKGRA